MVKSFFFGESFLFRLRAVFLGHRALPLDDHVAALGHAEGLLEQAEVIEFRSRRMFEGLKPTQESVFLFTKLSGKSAYFLCPAAQR